jgi:hypothetical protein
VLLSGAVLGRTRAVEYVGAKSRMNLEKSCRSAKAVPSARFCADLEGMYAAFEAPNQ